MSQAPLITLGIPAFGRAGYLRSAIQSCLAQTYPHIEILVADDASAKDPYPDIADLRSDKWSYVRHQKNLGGPGNFNYLIRRASGDIFILHQDDDLLHPEFCTRAAEALERSPTAVLFSGLMLRGPAPEGVLGLDLKTFTGPWAPFNYLKEQTHHIRSVDALLMLIMSTPFMHPAVAMRRSVLIESGGYYDRSMFASDNATFGRMLSYGTMLYDTRLSGYFRTHSENYSSSTSLTKQYECRREVANLLLSIVEKKDPNWTSRLTQLLAHAPRRECWKILTEAIEAGLQPKLLHSLVKALGPRERLNLWRARLLKASWKHQCRNLVR